MTMAGGGIFIPSDSVSFGSVGPLTVAQATLDFQNIPATFGSLLISIAARSTVAGATDTLAIRFNNDATAIYDTQLMRALAGVQTDGEANAETQARLGLIAGGTATAALPGAGSIFIPAYSGTTWNKVAIAQIASWTVLGAGGLTIQSQAGVWRSNVAINRVTLILTGGQNFDVGSVATLYGLS